MTADRSFSVAAGVAQRGARKLIGSPVGALAQMAIPLFFFIAFTGALSAVGNTKGFGYYDFTAFEFVFVLYQGAMFAGAFTAIDVGVDYGSGMGHRLMLSTPRRAAIIVGYLIVGLGRAALAVAVVWAVALAMGMPVRGDAFDIAGLVALALLLNLATTLYGVGVALRLQSAAAGGLVLIPIFMLLFLTPLFAPRDQLSGWLKAAADVNPLTAPLEAGRGFLADDPVRVGTAFATAGGLVVLFAIWAVRGMQRAEQGPGAPRKRGPRGRRAQRLGRATRTGAPPARSVARRGAPGRSRRRYPRGSRRS